jgi:hypothetical protein
MVFLMRHVHVNNGKRHENECLQRNDQNMKNCPAKRQYNLRSKQKRTAKGSAGP